MGFAGLPSLQLATIFAVSAALMVAFYILRLRRRAVAIPFSVLWERILKDKEATSLFSKLKRILSLLLQLALLALLVLALGDPRTTTSLTQARNLVVLLDASASMSATDVNPNRLEVAKEQIRALIRSLGGADRMLIAQMDTQVTPLGTMTADSSELERTLDGVHATDTRADFPRALRFATDALRGVEHGEIVVVSDGNLGPAADAAGPVHLGGVKLSFLPIGRGKRNVAVTQFAVRRYPLDKNRYEVMLEVSNLGPDAEDVELSLLGDGQLVDLTKLRIAPGERLPRFYPNLSGASRALEAKIVPIGGSRDELPTDDRAYALLPERRRAKVLLVSEGDTYLEAALLLDEFLDVTQLAPKNYVGNDKRYDVIIFDGATPPEMPRTNVLYIDPRGPGVPVKVGDTIAQPGFDKVDSKHPILRGISLEDVNVARAHKLFPAPGDKVLGAAESGPILVCGTRGGYKFVALAFDIRASDFPLRVSWPVFLVNTINWFTGEDASYLSSFKTGDIWRIPVTGGSNQAILTQPNGAKVAVPVHEGHAVVAGEHAGFYELATSVSDSKPVSFAANLLDPDESAISPATELVVDGVRAGKVENFRVGVRRDIWIYLVLVAAIVTAIEWGTYHRRITV